MGPDRDGRRVVGAGIGVVAVAYGLARDGYGLLLPDMRASFGLSHGALGLIAAGAYAAYPAAVAAAGRLSARFGPRLVVAAGGGLAIAGILIVAAASGPGMLAI